MRRYHYPKLLIRTREPPPCSGAKSLTQNEINPPTINATLERLARCVQTREISKTNDKPTDHNVTVLNSAYGTAPATQNTNSYARLCRIESSEKPTRNHIVPKGEGTTSFKDESPNPQLPCSGAPLTALWRVLTNVRLA